MKCKYVTESCIANQMTYIYTKYGARLKWVNIMHVRLLCTRGSALMNNFYMRQSIQEWTK